ncbi:hypothetical protein BN1708_020140, partial [Verticillium longisporum]
GPLRRPRNQQDAQPWCRQLDQLGSHSRAGRLLLPRLLRPHQVVGDAEARRQGPLRRADGQLWRHSGWLLCLPHGPACGQARRRDKRERYSPPLLDHGPLRE